MIKNEDEIDYYRDELDNLNKTDKRSVVTPTTYSNPIPKIATETTGWLYKKMHDITELCQAGDINRPNFVRMAANQKKLPSNRAGAKWLSDEEQLLVDQTEFEYYKEYWQTVIKRMLRFQKPLITNAHKVTKLSIDNDPYQKIYCHIEFVRPGRHHYCITQQNSDSSLVSF